MFIGTLYGIYRRIKTRIYSILRSILIESQKTKNLNVDTKLWGIIINEKGYIEIGGCDCVTLSENYGTPIYVVNKDLLIQNYNNFCESFKPYNINFETYYSYKTNPVPGVLNVLHDRGMGAEVISEYELFLSFKLGVNTNSIIYNGVNKTYEGLKLAIRNKIKLINIDSFNEIEKIHDIVKNLNVDVNAGVRVCTDVGWGGQFGLKIKTGEAFNAFQQLSKIRNIKLEGIHVHIGTGIKSPLKYKETIREIFRFLKQIKIKLGITIKYLDLGGGFGVPSVGEYDRLAVKLNEKLKKPHKPPDSSDTPSMKIFANEIVNTVKYECSRHKIDVPTLFFEPGRVITSNTQTLITKVGDIKADNDGFKFAVLDGGVNNAHPISWEYHEIVVGNKMNLDKTELYGIAGPTCSTSDVLSMSKKFPLLTIGDIIAIMDAGAYFTSFSYNFSFPRPAIVMVSQGNHYLIREKEKYEDMIRLDYFQ